MPRMYRMIDRPSLRATSRGLRRADARPSAAQPVNSSVERRPLTAPKPPSLFWTRSRYLVAFDAGEADAVPANASSITPATTAAGRQRTSNRRL